MRKAQGDLLFQRSRPAVFYSIFMMMAGITSGVINPIFVRICMVLAFTFQARIYNLLNRIDLAVVFMTTPF